MRAEVSRPTATECRPLQQGDLEGVVALHCSAFPRFFLTQLGPAFLRQLYRGFASDADGIALVAVAGGQMVGFAAGTARPRQHFRRLLRRRWFSFALAALPAVLRRPWRAGRKVAGALFYRGDPPPELPGAALLSSIGVDPAHAGQGAGRLLVEAFCAEARRRGCSSVYLTTDRDTNDATNRFYLRCGFVLESSMLKPGQRWMNRYVKELS